jgi:hypothetical protein
MFATEEERQKKGIEKLIWKIFKALRGYAKKNPQFNKKDAAFLLKNYGSILENVKEELHENPTKSN